MATVAKESGHPTLSSHNHVLQIIFVMLHWKAAVLQMWLHLAWSRQSYSLTRFSIRADGVGKQQIGPTVRQTKAAIVE